MGKVKTYPDTKVYRCPNAEKHDSYFQLYKDNERNHCAGCGAELEFRIVHRDGRPNSDEYITYDQEMTANSASTAQEEKK